MPKYTIILASGSGERAKYSSNNVPKQFVKIHNKQILSHTISRFKEFNPETKIILSILPDYKYFIDKSDGNYKNLVFSTGGITRAESVKNALMQINDYNNFDLVAIHDGVRPFFTKETFVKLKNTAKEKGNAIPYTEINESVRIIKNDKSSEFIDRKNIVKLQTPQFFNIKKLKDAYSNFYNEDLTDDSRIFELAGEKIYLVKGDYENIKITFKQDFEFIKTLLNN